MRRHLPGGTVPLPIGATPGNDYRIYAWFADFAGNRTDSASATATYSYTPTVAINHNNVFQIEVGASLGFTVDGTTSYSWTITDRSPDDVATFSGGGMGPVTGTSVTVVGNKVGTFTVTAGALKTATIKVVQSVMRGDTNGDKEITAQDAVDCFWLSFQTSWTSSELAAADFNQDNEVTSQDAVDIFWESLK